MHHGYRPLVSSFILDKVTNSRSKTHEIMLAATAVHLRDRESFRVYSAQIRESGIIAPYRVINAEGLEVNIDPVSSAVARYSAQRGARNSFGSVLQTLLPVCFCNSQCTDTVPGGVAWIQCENADCCVSFRDGWAHQACALSPGSSVPDSWMCPGCETGGTPVMTRVAAGSGASEVSLQVIYAPYRYR